MSKQIMIRNEMFILILPKNIALRATVVQKLSKNIALRATVVNVSFLSLGSVSTCSVRGDNCRSSRADDT